MPDDDPPPLTKQALEDVFKVLDSQPLKADRVFMNSQDYEDISGNRWCPNCNGFFPKELGTHPPDDCDLEKVRQIMES